MRTHRQGFLHNGSARTALLRGRAGVHSDDSMSSILSFDREDSEECAPTSVHDGLCKGMISHHGVDAKVLNNDDAMGIGELFRSFEMEVTTLAMNLEVSLCYTLRGFTAAVTALLPSA